MNPRVALDPYQYGNQKGSSTSHYLTFLLDHLLKGLDKGNTIGCLLLIDFKKAFDFVDHNVAVEELNAMGCRTSLLPFVMNFLTGRRHRVRYLDAISGYENTTCGVPQGTVLGPVVFGALVNRLCCTMFPRAKFVDDLSLGYLIQILTTIEFPMQEDINTLTDECQDKNMQFNVAKCEVMYANPTRRQTLIYPDLHLLEITIPVVQTCKLLGVQLNSQLNWNDHVVYITKKANRSMFILYRAKKFGFSFESMITLYVWFLRTVLEYACPVWHPGLNQFHHTRIERVQKRALRVILGNDYHSYDNALGRLNMTSLYERRETLTLRFGRSLLRSPVHRHLLPPTNGEVHGRRTRDQGRLRSVQARTERYRSSTIPYIVNLINRNMS